MIRIHPNGVKEMEESLAEFSAKPGDSFIVFEKRGGLFGVAVEPKKWLRTWTTVSGYNVNPHTELKKLMKKCAVCPYLPWFLKEFEIRILRTVITGDIVRLKNVEIQKFDK